MNTHDHSTKKKVDTFTTNTPQEEQVPDNTFGLGSFYAMQRAIKKPGKETLTPNVVLQLQCVIGNQAVQRLLIGRTSHSVEQATGDSPAVHRQGESGGNYKHNANLADTQERHHLISSNGGSIQRKMSFENATQYLNVEGEGKSIPLTSYIAIQKEARAFKNGTIEVRERELGDKRPGEASFSPDSLSRGGRITVKYLPPKDKEGKPSASYLSRLIAVAHETRHGLDDLGKKEFRFRSKKPIKIRTEWRAYATQAAVTWEIMKKSGKKAVEERYLMDLAAFANKDAFLNKKGRMFEITKSYMTLYGLPDENADVEKFMGDHDDWVDEALALYQSLLPQAASQKSLH